MPGPWVAGSDNPGFLATMSWSIGEIYEVVTYDTSGDRQGKMLIEVSDVEAKSRSGRWVDALVICAEDTDLAWWFKDGPGKKLNYEISLHVCQGPYEKCKEVNPRKMNEFHSDVIRHLDLEDIRKRRVTWWQNKANKKRFEKWRKEKLESGEGPSQKKRLEEEDDLDFEATEDEAEKDDAPDGEGKADKKKKAALAEKLSELKKQAAEKDATKRKKKKIEDTPKGVEKDKKRKKRKESDEKEGDRKEIAEEDVRSSSSRGDRRRVSRLVWFGRKRTPSPVRKKRKRSVSKEKTKGKAAKAGKDSSSDEESKTDKKDDSKKKKGKRRKADRGPYGSGRVVRYGEEDSEEASDSSSESVFQGGVPEKRAQQLVLLEYSDRKPGRLAARLLQKMELLLSRSGTPQLFAGGLKNRTPAVATSYLLTMIQPLYKERLNVRMTRELRTLAGALDLIAVGNPEKAADLLGQRLKALELVLSDQGWARAQYLELIPQEGAGLAEPEEQRMASKEQALEAKIRQYLPNNWKKDERPYGEGKGKGKKGKKGKGDNEEKEKKKEKAPAA